MPLSPSATAVRRLGVAVRTGNTEAEHTARQDVLAYKLAAFIAKSTKGQPPLRPEQRDALVAQLFAGGAA